MCQFPPKVCEAVFLKYLLQWTPTPSPRWVIYKGTAGMQTIFFSLDPPLPEVYFKLYGQLLKNISGESDPAINRAEA